MNLVLAYEVCPRMWLVQIQVEIRVVFGMFLVGQATRHSQWSTCTVTFQLGCRFTAGNYNLYTLSK